MKEIVARRTPRSKLFDLGKRNGKNRRMLRLSRGPLHYRNGRGELFDTNLSPTSDRGHALIDKAPFRLRVDENAPAYRYESLGGRSVSVELSHISGVDLRKSKPVYENGAFVWKNIAKDTDYIIRPTGQGVRTDIVLHSAKAPRNWKWTVLGDAELLQPVVGQDAQRKRLELTVENGEGFIAVKWSGRAQNHRQARKKEWSENIAYPARIDPTVNEAITDANDDIRSVSIPAYSAEYIENLSTVLAGRFLSAGWDSNQRGGFRFQEVAVPKSSTILSAVLTLNVVGVSGTPTLRVYGADVDDAASWSSSNRPVQIVKTTAFTDITPSATGTGYAVDVTDIISEILTRSGWSSGNNLAVAIFPNGLSTVTGTNFASFEAFEAAGTNEATLDIEYTESGGGDEDVLEEQDLDLASTVTDTPTLSVTHNLSEQDLDIPSIEVGSPPIGQLHELAEQNLDLAGTEVPTPSLEETSQLAEQDLDLDGTSAGTPTITQHHAIASTEHDFEPTEVGTPAISQVHQLTVNDLTLAETAIGTPALLEGELMTVKNLAKIGIYIGTHI